MKFYGKNGAWPEVSWGPEAGHRAAEGGLVASGSHPNPGADAVLVLSRLLAEVSGRFRSKKRARRRLKTKPASADAGFVQRRRSLSPVSQTPALS